MYCTIQSQNLSSLAVYNASENKIILKWLPSDYLTAKQGFIYGYQISRFQITSDSTISQPIVLDTIFPYNSQRWAEVTSENTDLIETSKLIVSDTEVQIDDSTKFRPDTLTETKLVHAYYIKEHNESMYMLLQLVSDKSLEAAKGLGLGYVDDYMIDTHNQYGYQITLLNDSLFTTYTRVDLETLDSLKAPEVLTPESGNKVVKLMWKLDEIVQYSYYDVFRSEDNVNYTQINENPYIFLSGEDADTGSYKDSIPENGVTYYYKIRGFSPFGFYGPFSEVVEVMGVPDPLPLGLTIDSISIESGDIVMRWSVYNRFDSIPVDMSTVLGYDLLFTTDVSLKPTLFSSVSDPSARSTSFETLQDGYYFIEAHDSNEYRYTSIPFLYQGIDSIPPAVPTGLQAVIGADKAVRLTWTPNTEDDLKGYYLYYAHGVSGDVFQMTSEPCTDSYYYTKSLDGFLLDDIYYGIVAVDKRGNQSAVSPLVHVTIPDDTPPAIPILAQVIPRPEGVRIAWKLSTSPDLSTHLLQRKYSTATQWQTIVNIKKPEEFPQLPQTGAEIMPSNYIDDDVLDVRTYDYRLVAIDSSSNRSYSDVVTISPYSVGEKGIINLFTSSLVQKMETYTPFPGASAVQFQNLSNTNVGNSTQGAVKGAYISDGKVARLQWTYDTDFPSSLEDFSVYQKITSPVPPNSYGASTVNNDNYVLIGTVKASEAYRIAAANGVQAYMYFVEGLQEKYLPMLPVVKPGTNTNPTSGNTVSSPFTYKIIANHRGGGYSRDGIAPLVIYQ
ncbi:MAG: hypothetical protein H6567_11060 [Lewinellaceae bacterium]|nr:hypothetical protein [Lewinellaceae bacterium]